MLCMPGKYFSRQKYFSQKVGFEISCKLSPEETICMKFESLISGENKIIINLLSAELAQRILKVKGGEVDA